MAWRGCNRLFIRGLDMARKVLFLGALAACSGGQEPPSSEYAILINPASSETTIIERSGKGVAVFGDVAVSDGLIQMGGGYFVVGSPGDFDTLYNGQGSWTLEFLMSHDEYDIRIIAVCAASTAALNIVSTSQSMPINVEINNDGAPVIFGSSFESLFIPEDMNHIALVFNSSAPTDGVAIFVNGVHRGYFEYEDEALFSTESGGTLMFGYNNPDSFLGSFKGIRMSNSILYPGTTSFTPPTEF